jgi:hypothetical protein
MKKVVFTLLIFAFISISGQKKVSNILNSTNITEIESFLKEAHPSDTRQILLKSKLAKLKDVQLKTNEEKSNIDLKVPVNPTKYFTETTQAEVKKEDNSDKKVELVPVNPTKYYAEKVQPEVTETVKIPVEKLALIPVNPTKFSVKETQPEETEKVRIPVEKLSLIPVNPTKFSTKETQPEETEKVKTPVEKLAFIPVNPMKFSTKETQPEETEKVKIPVEKLALIPVNPTKFSTKETQPEETEKVKTPVEKLALIPVNPTKFSTKATQPELKETVKAPVEKVALVPVNPTNYYTKTVPMNNINPTVLISEKRQPIGNNLFNNTPLKTQCSNNQPALNTTKSEVATVIVPNYYNPNGTEEEEFQKLFSETTKSHKDKTVKLLNQLFDNDVTNEHAILLVKNNGECNMIVRIQGNDYYNLAVPAHGENFVTVKKGNYQLSGNICEAKYSATKSIAKNMLVSLAKTPASFASPKIGLQSK